VATIFKFLRLTWFGFIKSVNLEDKLKINYEHMKEFFVNMDITQQVYWYIAIGASVFFILQTIVTFVGGGGGDIDVDVDVDVDTDAGHADSPFHFFSLRNLVSFLLGFGWTGVSLYNTITIQWLLLVIAIIVGLLFVAMFFFIIKTLLKLSEDNTFKMEDTVGKTGDVYIQIPPNQSGRGKVFVSVNGSTHELSAITEDGELLKVGTLVKVLKIEDKTLIVTAYK